MEESNVTFLFLGKKNLWSLFFPSPFNLVGIRPGARMQKSSLSMPPLRFRNTEVIYSGEWISKWKMQMWGTMEEESIL